LKEPPKIPMEISPDSSEGMGELDGIKLVDGFIERLLWN